MYVGIAQGQHRYGGLLQTMALHDQQRSGYVSWMNVEFQFLLQRLMHRV